MGNLVSLMVLVFGVWCLVMGRSETGNIFRPRRVRDVGGHSRASELSGSHKNELLFPAKSSPSSSISSTNRFKMYRQLARGTTRQLCCTSRPVAIRGYATHGTPQSFDWQDPLNAKSLFTEEELAISETAEAYCQERMLPRVLR